MSVLVAVTRANAPAFDVTFTVPEDPLEKSSNTLGLANCKVVPLETALDTPLLIVTVVASTKVTVPVTSSEFVFMPIVIPEVSANLRTETPDGMICVVVVAIISVIRR